MPSKATLFKHSPVTRRDQSSRFLVTGPTNAIALLTDHNIFGSVLGAVERARQLIGNRNGRPQLRSRAPHMVHAYEPHVEDYVI